MSPLVKQMNWRSAALSIVLVLLVLTTTGPGLQNGFVYDDVPLVRDNPSVHQLSSPWTYLNQSYWHHTACCWLYRPLTVWSLAVQWRVGGGEAWVFHLVNLALYLGLTFAVYAFVTRMCGRTIGWFAAAVFAIHPVHVESTGNIVGQAELLMATAVVAGAGWYLRLRESGDPRPRDLLIVAGLTLTAGAAKEQGLVLPALLAALEIFVVRDPRPWAIRVTALRPLASAAVLAALGLVAARLAVLGNLGGGPLPVSLEGLSIVGRTRLMLGIVPEWYRLLLWPARLRADYTPPAFGASAELGEAQLVGVLLLAVSAALAWHRRRDTPAATLAVLWTGLALFPVSNILFPTGILLAERTLLLPSASVAILAGLVAGASLSDTRPGIVRGIAGIVCGAVLIAGAVRSSLRQGIWRDNRTFFARMIQDAPGSYRAFSVYGSYLALEGDLDAAAREFQRSAELFPQDPKMLEEYGQVLRREHRCGEALPILGRALELDSSRPVARSRLYFCLMEVGDTTAAQAVASEGVRLGLATFEPLVRRAKPKAERQPGPP
jgi:hypothetical protein